MNEMLNKFFSLKANNTNIRTEVLAGITTFVTMAYIIFVNPSIISITAGPELYGSLTVATCIAAAIGTLMMALYAKLPFAQAPGMGLNAFFAFSIIPLVGYGGALSAVFISGIIFILITVLGFREVIVKAIPQNIKLAISVGIGLFIALIGCKNAGLIVDNPATLVALVDFSKFNAMDAGKLSAEAMSARGAAIAIFGLLVTGILYKFKVRGSILIGILISTVLAFPLQMTSLPHDLAAWNISLSPTLFKFDFAALTTVNGSTSIWGSIFTAIAIVISFTLVDMFDTIGTLVGTAEGAGMLDKNGNVPNMKKAMMADAVATSVGSCVGSSTVTTYVESSAGIAAGGRTGLTSLVTGILFLLAIILAPIAGIVPAAATAPALIIVGVFMMSQVSKINFSDITEALPAFAVIILMPFTYSIATGIAAGLIFHPILKAATGKVKEVHPLAWILAILFILKFTVLPK
jgi:adenine/guanine/hypoxanthine permease